MLATLASDVVRSALLLLVAGTPTGPTTGPTPARQPRPDFAGTWRAGATVSTPLPPANRSGEGSTGKTKLVLTQNGKQLTITGGAVSSTYAFDGSVTTNYIRLNGKPFAVTSRARWEGTHLITTTHIPFETGAHDVTHDVSIDAQGDLVLRETRVSKIGTRTFTLRYHRQSPIM